MLFEPVMPQETNQEVPGWLASLASRGGSYGGNSKRRGGGNRFGGRDFRNDRRGGGGGGAFPPRPQRFPAWPQPHWERSSPAPKLAVPH